MFYVAALIVVALIYVGRTGNYFLPVMTWEARMRELLEGLVWARPRTKEFLSAILPCSFPCGRKTLAAGPLVAHPARLHRVHLPGQHLRPRPFSGWILSPDGHRHSHRPGDRAVGDQDFGLAGQAGQRKGHRPLNIVAAGYFGYGNLG